MFTVFFTPFKKTPEINDSGNVPGNHNPKVASSNLATATTKSNSQLVFIVYKNQKINTFNITQHYTKKNNLI